MAWSLVCPRRRMEDGSERLPWGAFDFGRYDWRRERSPVLKRTVLCIAAISLILSLGCSKREDLVVAKVADRNITVAGFEKASETMEDKYLPKTNDLAGKKELLDHMINKEIMGLKARAAGYEKDKEFVEFFEKWRMGYIIAALDNEYIIKKVTITEQQVKEYYDRMNYEYTISQIVVPSEDQARGLREQILAGADFAELAKKYSMSPEGAEGGYIGPNQIGRMHYWVEEALAKMNDGDVSEPLATTTGWALIKLHSLKKMLPEQDMEYARKRVRAIAQKKAIEAMRHVVEKDINLTISPEALDMVYQSLPPDIPFEDIINYKITRENAPKLEIPEQYQEMILAQYVDKTYTLKDYIKIYESLPLPDRPRRQTGKEGIISSIHERIFDSALPAYAEQKLKILEIPEIAKGLEAKKEQFLVFRLYRDQVKNLVNVTEQQVRDYYNAHQAEITSAENREYTIVLVSTKAKAEMVAGLARRGEDIGKLASEYSEDSYAKENMGRTGLTPKGNFPDYDAVAFSLAEGQVSDPFQVPRGWAVVKVMRIEAPRPVSLEEAANTVKSGLMEAQADSLLKTRLVEWRKDFPVKINERNLQKAELKKTRPLEEALRQKDEEQLRLKREAEAQPQTPAQ